MFTRLKVSLLTACVFFLGTAHAADITIAQNNKSFEKDGAKISAITIKAGDTIHFKNEDPWFHNIFSLSPLKTFDLGSYPAGQSKSVTYDKPGKAEVECAIHPQMFLEVIVK
jgi:plastocyanin